MKTTNTTAAQITEARKNNIPVTYTGHNTCCKEVKFDRVNNTHIRIYNVDGKLEEFTFDQVLICKRRIHIII